MVSSLLLFGSFGVFIASCVILFIVFILAEAFESGYPATIAVIVFVIANYVWGNFAWLVIFTPTNIVGYILVGFLFSIIRTYFKGREFNIQKAAVPERDKEGYRNRQGQLKEHFELKEHVFRWIFLWPASLLVWVFGSILVDLWDFLYAKISKMYEYIFNL